VIQASLARLAVDLSPLRESRELRLLLVGWVVSGLGTQAALVALPYQVYVKTGSALLTGLLGAVELVPLIAMALLGGAVADRFDRRRLLLLDQGALVLIASALAACTFAGWTPVAALYVLAGLLAGFGAVQSVVRTAMIPGLAGPELLRPALALNFALSQLTMVVGPALGGVTIGLLGVGAAYTADALSCLAMVGAAAAMRPQPPDHVVDRPGIRRSIGEGVGYVWRTKALKASFATDLMAMTFGMPRAVFPVLAVSVYHAGAAGTGLLYASVAAGGTVTALASGWLGRARRLGRILLVAVAVWGAAVALAGFAGSLLIAAALLAVAGGADSVSAVCRATITQSITPDRLRGRMSSVHSLVVTSGPRLGDVRAGAVAALAGVRFSVVSGGLACIAAATFIALRFPALVRYDADDWLAVNVPIGNANEGVEDVSAGHGRGGS
jgi:MFS family permease